MTKVLYIEHDETISDGRRLASSDPIKFKLDGYGGRRLRLNALAQLRRP